MGVFCTPFGPLTSSSRSLTVMSTPLGIVIAFFPIRDIALPLINLRQQFAANIFATGGFAAHQATRSGHNVDSVTAEDARDVMRTDIDTASGSRHSFQVRNRRSSTRVVTQENAHGSLDAFALDYEVIDVAFFFKKAGDFKFKFRSRDIHAGVFRRNSVAD